MNLECDRCETPFDTDREPVTRGADTTRCPSCGHQHEVAAEADRIADAATPDGGREETIRAEGSTVRIVIEVNPDEQS